MTCASLRTGVRGSPNGLPEATRGRLEAASSVLVGIADGTPTVTSASCLTSARNERSSRPRRAARLHERPAWQLTTPRRSVPGPAAQRHPQHATQCPQLGRASGARSPSGTHEHHPARLALLLRETAAGKPPYPRIVLRLYGERCAGGPSRPFVAVGSHDSGLEDLGVVARADDDSLVAERLQPLR